MDQSVVDNAVAWTSSRIVCEQTLDILSNCCMIIMSVHFFDKYKNTIFNLFRNFTTNLNFTFSKKVRQNTYGVLEIMYRFYWKSPSLSHGKEF